MAKFLIVCLALAACVATGLALATPTQPKAAPIYLGYNATYCRGLNFTIYVPGNCSAFYQCQGNNIWLNYCQYPLQYNHLNGFCDHPWNVRCNRTGKALTKAAVAPAPPVKAPPVYLGYNATFCRNMNFTTFVPNNCSAFYQCQSNQMWLNYCQYPLQYNHLNGFCDYSYNVRCNRTLNRTARAAPLTKSQLPTDTIRPPVNVCAPQLQVMCFVAPCQFAKCPNHPDAQCFDDYCGGCHARFFKTRPFPGSTAPMFPVEVTQSCGAN